MASMKTLVPSTHSSPSHHGCRSWSWRIVFQSLTAPLAAGALESDPAMARKAPISTGSDSTTADGQASDLASAGKPCASSRRSDLSSRYQASNRASMGPCAGPRNTASKSAVSAAHRAPTLGSSTALAWDTR